MYVSLRVHWPMTKDEKRERHILEAFKWPFSRLYDATLIALLSKGVK
jgi:hypothetical protein